MLADGHGDGHRKGGDIATYPDARIVLLLVGLVLTLGVSDLGLEVVDVLGDKVTDTAEVGPLEISIEVDLYNTVGDGDLEL